MPRPARRILTPLDLASHGQQTLCVATDQHQCAGPRLHQCLHHLRHEFVIQPARKVIPTVLQFEERGQCVLLPPPLTRRRVPIRFLTPPALQQQPPTNVGNVMTAPAQLVAGPIDAQLPIDASPGPQYSHLLGVNLRWRVGLVDRQTHKPFLFVRVVDQLRAPQLMLPRRQLVSQLRVLATLAARL
ncbi:MAG: hypothetical protein KDA57_18125 [Planctomycetales bacterium]|nr:hypothetical protein [Planctomycetales bacterium]